MSNSVAFSANQVLFIEWCAQAKDERMPKTQEEFADKIGVTSRTLGRWKKLDGFSDAVIIRAREIIREDLAEIYGATRREAIGGSFQHAKLLLEVSGEYVEKRGFSSEDPLHVVIEYADS